LQLNSTTLLDMSFVVRAIQPTSARQLVMMATLGFQLQKTSLSIEKLSRIVIMEAKLKLCQAS
jgi:hypothetical protein